MQGGTSAVVIVHLVCLQVGFSFVHRMRRLERSSVHSFFFSRCLV
jgi:hypothetical protein